MRCAHDGCVAGILAARCSSHPSLNRRCNNGSWPDSAEMLILARRAGALPSVRLHSPLVTGANRVHAREFHAANGYEVRKEQTNLIKWW